MAEKSKQIRWYLHNFITRQLYEKNNTEEYSHWTKSLYQFCSDVNGIMMNKNVRAQVFEITVDFLINVAYGRMHRISSQTIVRSHYTNKTSCHRPQKWNATFFFCIKWMRCFSQFGLLHESHRFIIWAIFVKNYVFGLNIYLCIFDSINKFSLFV